MPPPSQLSNLNYLSNFHVPPTVHLSIPPICQLTLFLSLPAVTLFLPSPISNWQKAVLVDPWNSMTKHYRPIGRSLICIIPHSGPLDRLLPIHSLLPASSLLFSFTFSGARLWDSSELCDHLRPLVKTFILFTVPLVARSLKATLWLGESKDNLRVN